MAIASRKLLGHGAWACESANDGRHRVRGRALNAQVDRSGQQLPCEALARLLPGQGMKERSKRLAHMPKQGCAAPCGDEHHVIRAIPPGMRQALSGMRPGVLLRWAHQATGGALYSQTAQSGSSRTGQTSGLPQRLSYARGCCCEQWLTLDRLCPSRAGANPPAALRRRLDPVCPRSHGRLDWTCA
jgi:hypothetical protein